MSGATTRSPRREWLDLQPPAEPELREAVQQNDQRPFTRLDVMQAHVADVGVALTKLGPVVRRQVGERVGESCREVRRLGDEKPGPSGVGTGVGR